MFCCVKSKISSKLLALGKTRKKPENNGSAVAHLHFFTGRADWWTIETDSDPDNAGQIQAFGIADLGMGPELGYISIPVLLEVGAELDFYYDLCGAQHKS